MSSFFSKMILHHAAGRETGDIFYSKNSNACKNVEKFYDEIYYDLENWNFFNDLLKLVLGLFFTILLNLEHQMGWAIKRWDFRIFVNGTVKKQL